VEALGPLADELIATRAGAGAIAPVVGSVATTALTGGITGTLVAPPPMGIAYAAEGNPAVAITARAANHRLI
jgi:hypothetical protein